MRLPGTPILARPLAPVAPGRYIPLTMRASFTLLVSLSLLPPGAAAQGPWTEPVSAPWPLADIAMHRTVEGNIRVLALPNPITAQSDSSDTYLDFQLDPAVVAAWVPRARRFVDSVLRGPRDINDSPAGLSLPVASETGKVTLAHQPNARPTARFLLVFGPAPPARGWSVQGGTDAARRLIAALETVLTHESPMALDTFLPRDPACRVSALGLVQSPRMNLPTQKRLGGRVLLEFVVNADGLPIEESVHVLLSSGKEYTREVRRYLPQMRYAPGLCGGVPVPVPVQQGFSWTMELRR